MSLDHLMTIGELSRHTGATVKALRTYTDLGLIYTAGRSPANYRMYDADALWCVRLISELRRLGITVAEIVELNDLDGCPRQSHGPWLAERLLTSRARIDAKIAELERVRASIDAFRDAHRDGLAGPGPAWLLDDPRRCAVEA